MAVVPTSGFRKPAVPAPLPIAQAEAPPAPRFRPTNDERLEDATANAFGIIQRREIEKKEVASEATRRDPQKAARANQIAPWVGVPPEMVEDKLDDYEGEMRAKTVRAAMDRSLEMAGWLSNPRRAAVSHDDTDALERSAKTFEVSQQNEWNNKGWLGKTWQTVKDIGTGIGPSLAAGAYGAGEGIEGAIGATSDFLDAIDPKPAIAGFMSDVVATYTGYNPRWDKSFKAAEEARRAGTVKRVDALREEQRAWRPLSQSWVARDILSGTESVPLAAATMLTRSSSMMAGAFGATTGGKEYLTAREQGLDLGSSLAFAARQGAVETITEKIPAMRLVADVAKRSPFLKTFLGQLGAEIPGEQAATLLQNFDTWVTLNPEKSFADYAAEVPAAAGQTLLATLGAVGTTTGGVSTARATVGAIDGGTRRIVKAAKSYVQARSDARTIDQVMEGAAESKTRERDPRLFEEFIEGIAQGSPIENVFVPAEAIRELYQSNGWEMGSAEDGQLGGMTDDFWQQVDAGLQSGGDVVIPIAAVAAHLAGTPAWEALRSQVRVSPGGNSLREAEAFENEYADQMAQLGEQVAAQALAERDAAAPRERVFEAVLGQAREAGFSVNSAKSYADLWADRYETRAERLGDGRTALDLFEQSFAGIRQDLPDRVKPYRKGDGLDVLINAVKTGAQRMTPRAKSLIETIVEGGGLNDDGGDIKSMGGDKVVRGGVFGRARKALIRDQSGDGQASMLPGTGSGNDFSLDYWAERLQSLGFFGDLQDRASVNDVIDAVGQELRGTPVYPTDAELDPVMEANNALLDAADDLREILDRLGVDVATASRDEIDAALARWEAEGDAAFGFDQLGARGRIDFLADSKAAITLFEGRDLSTLLHEGGHLWLEELRGDALSTVGQDDASPTARKLFADWEAVKAWFKREGIDVNDSQPIPTEAHELWARGMERYFMEGKAPSRSLAAAFSSFRAWLLRIYKVVANLQSNIDDDVRGVFDRLIATDQAIAWAIHEADERALFETVVPEGMSGQERLAYTELIEQSRTEAFDALLFRTMERVRRKRTVRYKEEEAKVRAEVQGDIEARPEFAAIRLMRGVGVDHMPLDLDGVIARVGRDAIPLLPKGSPKAKTITANGVNPDIVAEAAGFPDGKTMLEALIGVEDRRRELVAANDKRTVQQEAVDVETEARMIERHGDIFDDGSIEDEALEIIQTDAGSERLASEIRMLSRAIDPKDAEGPPTPLDVVRGYAERIVREGRIIDQASGAAVERHRKAKAKASREAERSYLNGDNVVALKAKQREMIASELWRASRAAKDNVDVIARRLDKLARTRNLKGMDQEYLERIHEVLESYDLRPRSRDAVRERERFDTWAKAQAELGFEVFVPERLTLAGNKHFTKLTYEEIVAIDDTVQSLAHLGRQKMELTIANDERLLEDRVERAEAAALALPIRAFSDARNAERRLIADVDAGLVKIEFIADQMDNGDPNGEFNAVLVKGATHAANEKERLTRQVVDPLAKMYLEMPKAQRKRLAERVTVPEFITVNPETKAATPTTFTRGELLAVALNTGNASNLEKMLIGETLALPDGLRSSFGWTEDRVMAVLDREMNEADWRFVEKIWFQINTLWPDIARSEREISGVAPEKIEGRLVSTKYGTFQGGYYPVVFDPQRSQIAADNADGDLAKILGGIGKSVSTPKGHTITRTDAAMPLHYSLERVLFNHINRVTTRIAYGSYARSVLQWVGHPKIRKLMNIHIGPEYHAQIKPWLQRQVSDASLDVATLSGIERIFRQVRVNSTMVGLGLRFTTMAAQLGGWSNSAGEIGPQWMARGMKEVARNGLKSNLRDWVFAQSPEMAGRAEAFDRDVRTFYRDAGRKLRGRGTGRASKVLDGIAAASEAVGLEKLQAGAFWGIGMIDVYLVAMPTWVGAYYKATESMGMGVADAIAFADKAVRKSQSAGRTKDLSAFQDSNEGYRQLTTFYSYFSIFYNKQRETNVAFRQKDWRKAMTNIFWIMMVGPLAGALLTGDWPDEEDQDVEGWMTWAASRFFFGLFAGVPGVRDIASITQREIEGKFTGGIEAPFARAYSEVKKPVEDAIKLSKGEEPSERWLKNVITPIGYFVGLPTGQIGQSAQYLADVADGSQNPDGVGQALYGFAKGPQDNQE